MFTEFFISWDWCLTSEDLIRDCLRRSWEAIALELKLSWSNIFCLMIIFGFINSFDYESDLLLFMWCLSLVVFISKGLETSPFFELVESIPDGIAEFSAANAIVVEVCLDLPPAIRDGITAITDCRVLA